MATDARTLEKTSTAGIYRRHADGCKRNGHCQCPYVVRWKALGKSHKQMFATFELAREFKGTLASGKTPRKPQSAKSVRDYWSEWFPNYRGRTVRGLSKSTRREYHASFEHHIRPLPIARIKMRDVTPPDVRAWCEQLEARGVSPRSIKHAKLALGLMFSCGAEDGEVGSNPVQPVRYIPSAEARERHARPEPKKLTAADVLAILGAMPEPWRAFFYLLAHSGVRVGELLGLTWRHVHLGDDPHVAIEEQVYRGERKEPSGGARAKCPSRPIWPLG